MEKAKLINLRHFDWMRLWIAVPAVKGAGYNDGLRNLLSPNIYGHNSRHFRRVLLANCASAKSANS